MGVLRRRRLRLVGLVSILSGGHIRVAVFGAGGIGSYFGGRLAAGGADVHLIARGAHLEALRREGLRVRSTKGDFEALIPATDDPADIGPVDYVLFTVKSHHTAATAAQLGPLLQDGTAVLSLQNGLGNEDAIASQVGKRHVMGGVAYLVSTIEEPGVVVHSAGPGSVIFGELDGSRSQRAVSLLRAFENSGVEATLSDHVRLAIWDKFAFICALSGMTAAVRLPIGDIRSEPESWSMFRALLREVARVAAAEGVHFPDEVLRRHEQFAQDLEEGTLSSLHYDLTHGKPMELEALQGELLRRARGHGIEVPRTEAVYAILRPWAVRNLGVGGRPPG